MLTLPVLTRRWIASGAASFPFFRPGNRCWRAAWLAGVTTVLLAVPATRADITSAKQKGKLPRGLVANPPASAVPSSEELDPGEQVEITLAAHGGGNKTIEFDIATQPKHGLLSGLRILSRNQAVVTYTHDPSSGPGQDEFTYRVQATGLPMSGPATVDLTIHEYPPRLVASPAEVDFGVVKAGEVSRAQVTVRNDGGGLATGRIDPPEPWSVEGVSDFRLGPGEKQVIHLVFKPENGRSFSETMRIGDAGIGAQRNASIHLFGAGLGGPAARQFAGINGVPPAPEEAPGASSPLNPDVRAGSNLPAGEPVTPAAARVAGGPGSPSSRSAGVSGGGSGANSSGGSGGNTGNVAESPTVGGTRPGAAFEPPEVILNEAGVKQLTARGHSRTWMEVAWKEPQPRPAKYRVELQHLSLDRDHDDDLVVTWQPYAKVNYKVTGGLVTAALQDLPAGTNQTVRVVAIDAAGHFAAPSPSVEVMLDAPWHWWRLSLLQWLMVALAICAFLVVRKRLEDRQILAQIDLDRAERRRVNA